MSGTTSGTTWRFRAEGDRVVVHSITSEDGTEMVLPGSWAEVVVESPEEISFASLALSPEALALYRQERKQ